MNPSAKHLNYWAGAGLVFAIIEDTKEKRTYQIIMTPNVSIEANNDKLRMNYMKYSLTMTLSMQ